MTTQEKKLTDCYWFLQNKCSKGNGCEYRHSPESLKTTTTCKEWLDNKCNNKDCPLRHPSGGNKAVIPCYYFMHGGCMKGTDCPFSHQVSDTLPTKSTPDIEAIRKKQEEELKLLQQERIREEQRLAKLKQELLQTQKTKGIETRKRLHAGDNNNNNLKEKQDKMKNNNKANNDKAGSITKRLKTKELTNEALTTKTNQTKKQGNNKSGPAPTNFGIKSLDELLKEKEAAAKVATATSSNTTKAVVSTEINNTSPKNDKKGSGIDLEALRKKNEMKFSKTTTTVTATATPTKTTQGNTTTSEQTTTQKNTLASVNITKVASTNFEDDLDQEIENMNSEILDGSTDNLDEDLEIDDI